MEFLEVLTEGLERVLMVRGSGREVITIYSWTKTTGIDAVALREQSSSLLLSDLNDTTLRNILLLCHCLRSHLRCALWKSLKRRGWWWWRRSFISDTEDEVSLKPHLHGPRRPIVVRMMKPKATMPKDRFSLNEFLNVERAGSCVGYVRIRGHMAARAAQIQIRQPFESSLPNKAHRAPLKNGRYKKL